MTAAHIPSATETVPVALLCAAIDVIAYARPPASQVDRTVIEVAVRLDYDAETATALALRVRAAARMFADPLWPGIRQLGRSLDAEQRLVFEATVRAFIAAAPLDDTLALDVGLLQRRLTEILAPHGHG